MNIHNERNLRMIIFPTRGPIKLKMYSASFGAIRESSSNNKPLTLLKLLVAPTTLGMRQISVHINPFINLELIEVPLLS